MKAKFFLVIVVILAVIITGVGFMYSFFGQTAVIAAKSDIKVFSVKAFKYGFDPNIITVNKGDKVKINITNFDIIHGISIPDLRVNGNDKLEFPADKLGEFVWYCNNYCGDGHSRMQGKLIVQ